jgi:hypothetical protein
VSGGLGSGREPAGDGDARLLFFLTLAALVIGAGALIVYVSVH